MPGDREKDFLRWYNREAVPLGLSPDPDDPLHFYDWRQLWRDNPKAKADASGHWPSKYKLGGHPNLFIPGDGGLIDSRTGRRADPQDVQQSLLQRALTMELLRPYMGRR